MPMPPAGPAGPPVELPTLDFLGLFQVLARRKWILIAMLTFWVGLAVLFLKKSPEIYESTGMLRVRSQNPHLAFTPVQEEDLRTIDALKTVEQNLWSTSLAKRMIVNHGLSDHLQGSIANQIMQLHGQSAIELVRGTRVLSINYRSKDPEFAKRVVDAYITEFQLSEQEGLQQVQQHAKEDLAEQEERLRGQLREAEKALKAFEEKYSNFDLRKDGNIVGDTLSELMRQHQQAKIRVIDLKNQLGDATAGTTNLLEISSIAAMPKIVDLQSKLSERVAEFETLKRTFGPKHRRYKEAQSTVQAAQSNLDRASRDALNSLRRDYESARVAEEQYASELATQQGEVHRRQQIFAEYERLKADVTNFETVINDVNTRLLQTEVNSGLDTNIIHVSQEPMVAEYPIWPNKPFILAGGLLLGLMSGVALAFALEMLRRRVRDEQDVLKILPGTTCLTQVPAVRIRKPEDKLVLAHSPHSLAAEAFRSLRTALYFHDRGEPRIITVTSANAGDGKSFCAMNIAASYAMQGYQTLLIDGDLRCPTLEEVFLKGRNRGMTDLLRGRAEPPDICYPTEVNGLYFIPSGDLRPNPAELLASNGLLGLLQQASEFFDKIIIDSAPLVPVSDGLMLTRHADATCLVVRANGTKKQDLHKVRQILAKTGQSVTGFILNGSTDGNAESSYVTYMSQQQRLALKDRGKEVPALPARAETLSKKAAML